MISFLFHAACAQSVILRLVRSLASLTSHGLSSRSVGTNSAESAPASICNVRTRRKVIYFTKISSRTSMPADSKSKINPSSLHFSSTSRTQLQSHGFCSTMVTRDFYSRRRNKIPLSSGTSSNLLDHHQDRGDRRAIREREGKVHNTDVDGLKMNSDGNLETAASVESNSSMELPIAGQESLKSPGSLLSASIRSDQVESFDIESDSSGENPGWKLGMPWFGSNHNRHSKKADKDDEIHRYYGGIMKPQGEGSPKGSPASSKSTSGRGFRSLRKSKKRPSPSKAEATPTTPTKEEPEPEITKEEKDETTVPIARNRSNVDSIADFDESEWTPADSSYGAACPVCGCIPKRVRQMIEMTLIFAMVFFLIYLVVRTSMKVAEAHRMDSNSSHASASDKYFNSGSYNRTSSSSTNIVTDDDVYVEKYNYYIDDAGQNGDDATASDDKYGNNNAYSQNNNQKYNAGNSNKYYNNNYNGGRRLLRGSERKRIFDEIYSERHI